IGEAAGRLGDEFISLLHQLEPRLADPDDTLPGVARGDSAVARAARLSSHIMLSGMPCGSGPDRSAWGQCSGRIQGPFPVVRRWGGTDGDSRAFSPMWLSSVDSMSAVAPRLGHRRSAR